MPDWRQYNPDGEKLDIKGAAWLYLIWTSVQKKKKNAVLNKRAWTERYKDLKKKKTEHCWCLDNLAYPGVTTH